MCQILDLTILRLARHQERQTFKGFSKQTNNSAPREDKGDREGIPYTNPIPWVIRLDVFLESG